MKRTVQQTHWVSVQQGHSTHHDEFPCNKLGHSIHHGEFLCNKDITHNGGFSCTMPRHITYNKIYYDGWFPSTKHTLTTKCGCVFENFHL